MTRIAHGCCGSLRAEANGEPVLVHVCNCTECQRRTGSVFGVSSFFWKTAANRSNSEQFYSCSLLPTGGSAGHDNAQAALV